MEHQRLFERRPCDEQFAGMPDESRSRHHNYFVRERRLLLDTSFLPR